jgi:hypothetical protein
VLWRARRIKARHLRTLGAPLPALRTDLERLVDSPLALYHGTRFADGSALVSPRWSEACVGDLYCTEEALFLLREQGGAASGELLALPLAWVEDVSLVRAYAPLARKELPMLRVRWRRGGELLDSDFSLKGGMASLELLRRELHLRQANVLEKLRPLLDREPP